MSFEKKIFAFASLAFCFLTTSYAQPIQKNGLPCVKEICLGDGLPELNKIKWIRAQSSRGFMWGYPMNKLDGLFADAPVAKDDLQWKWTFPFLKGNEQDVRKAVPYIFTMRFDGTGLPLIGKIEAICQGSPRLIGRYESESGHPTVVGITMLPSTDGLTQSWVVTSINRFFPGNITQEQSQELRASIYATYADFRSGRQGAFVGEYIPRDGPYEMILGGHPLDNGINAARFINHPSCGAVKGKIQLN